MMRRRQYCVLLAIGGGASARPFGISQRVVVERRIPMALVSSAHDDSLLFTRGGSSETSMYDKDEEEEENDVETEEEEGEEEEEEDEDEEDETADDTSTANKPKIPSDPVFLTIQTASGSSVLDETIELETVLRTRTVLSVKESISKKLAAKPPPSTMALSLDGRLLGNDEIVNDIVKEVEEDAVEHDDDEHPLANGIVLTMEAIAPVDPKFLPDLERKIPDLTSEELLQAYTANEAALYQNSLILDAPRKDVTVDDDEEQEEVDEQHDTPPIRVNTAIQQRMARIRADLDSTILDTANVKELLANDIAPNVRKQQQSAKIDIRGQRIRKPGKSTSLRGILQHNLNVDWYKTGRAIFVLLFFGFFGGRTALSKSILLMCAPLLIIVQARGVKSVLSQLMYTVLFHPPSIVLSLLPAPQQTILSMDYDAAMEIIYGDQLKDDTRKKHVSFEDRLDESDPEDDVSEFSDAPEFEEDDESEDVDEDTDDVYDSDDYE